MTETERRYAQIEREVLVATWACKKFLDYVIGKRFHLETDHKLLVPLLSSKQLDNLPPRIVKFRLQLMRYDYSISHVPGKYMYTADTLLCDPTIITTSLGDCNLKDIEHFVEVQVESLPASKDRLDIYRQAQMNDSLCSQVIKYCQSSWPEKHHDSILSKTTLDC